ncbi:MAG: tetratricopeptide repeat protein, partial [Gemmataceae bacterium]|nr:tetratricopeptide repeat protein [Gemmataceae bacterium]
RRAKLGADHPDTLASMNNLAACCWSMQRLDRSVPLFEEVLPHLEKKLGREHPDTQLAAANLAVNYKDAGRLKEALPLLEEAYRSAKKHPNLRWVGQPLVEAYVKSNKSVEAAKLIEELLAEARRKLPKQSPQLAGQLAEYGLLLLELKSYNEAEPLLRECLAIREKTQPNAWTTFNTLSLLGGALVGRAGRVSDAAEKAKLFAEAEPLLVKGYEGMKARAKTIPPAARQLLPEALDRLVELYTATGQPEQVKKYQAERTLFPAN